MDGKAPLLDGDNDTACSARQLEREDAVTPLPFCKVSLVLSYGIILGLITNGLISIAVPTEMGLYSPNNAGLINGLLIAAGALTNLFGPVVGLSIDRVGRQFYVKAGGTTANVGVGVMLLAVYFRSRIGLGLYCVGFVLAQVGNVILTTTFQTIVADYGSIYPEKLGNISGIWGIYMLLGALISYVAAGVVFPITEHGHGFYFLMMALGLGSNLILLFTERKVLDVIQTGIRKEGGDDSGQGIGELTFTMLREWWADDQYKCWRSVVLSRFQYYVAAGVFSSYGLYYIEDHTNAGNPTTDFTIIAAISMGGSFLASYPAGLLSDKFGSVMNVIVSTIAMSVFFFFMGFNSNIFVFMAVVPIYGFSQQVYNVADLALIAISCPDPAKKSRDIGGWGAAGSVGTALGAAYAGVLITIIGRSNSRTTVNGHERVKYTRAGYLSIFLSAAACVLCGAYVLWVRRESIRSAELAQKKQRSSLDPAASIGRVNTPMNGIGEEPSTAEIQA